MKTKYKVWVTMLIVISLFFVADVRVVFGQVNDYGLSLVTSPLPVSLVTFPGSTVSAQLKIKNAGINPEKIHIGLMKFGAYGDEGNPKLIDREGGDEYFDWVGFSDNDFTLASNEWKTILMEITVPNDAAFGYYYAVTFSRFDDQVTTGQRSTKILGAVASLVLLEVRVPQADREIEVVSFGTSQKVYEFLPTTFNLNLRNKGNVHVAPRGNIFIDSGNKKDLALLEVNSLRGSILPSSSRNFEVEWLDGFPIYAEKVVDKTVVTDKHGKPEKILKWDFSQVPKFRLGKYKASLLLTYDDGQRDVPIEAWVSFWVIPWRIMLAAVVIIGVLLLGLFMPIYVLMRKRKRK